MACLLDASNFFLVKYRLHLTRFQILTVPLIKNKKQCCSKSSPIEYWTYLEDTYLIINKCHTNFFHINILWVTILWWTSSQYTDLVFWINNYRIRVITLITLRILNWLLTLLKFELNAHFWVKSPLFGEYFFQNLTLLVREE